MHKMFKWSLSPLHCTPNYLYIYIKSLGESEREEKIQPGVQAFEEVLHFLWTRAAYTAESAL